MNNTNLKLAALLVALLVLPSCGGGGGDGFVPEIDINPPELETDTGTPTEGEYISTWFTCTAHNVCVEYRYASRSAQDSAMQQCSLVVGGGQLCYGTYGRPAFGTISPGCRQTNSSGDIAITYELNPSRTSQEYNELCRAHGGEIEY